MLMMLKSEQCVLQMKIMRCGDIHNIDRGILQKFFIAAVRFRDMKLVCKLFCCVDMAGTDGVQFGIVCDLKRCRKFVRYPSRAYNSPFDFFLCHTISFLLFH